MNEKTDAMQGIMRAITDSNKLTSAQVQVKSKHFYCKAVQNVIVF